MTNAFALGCSVVFEDDSHRGGSSNPDKECPPVKACRPVKKFRPVKQCRPGYDLAVSLRQNIRDFFHGAAYGAYERELRLQAAELNDLFLLLCYMEIVGLPNPATFYLLDVYPYLLEQFHMWHKRMGMDRSPLGNLPCC